MCMKFLKKKFMLAGWTFLLGAGIFIFSENVAFADTGDLEVVTSAGISTVLSEAVLSTQGNEGATLADYDYDSLGIISLSSGSLNVRKEASTDSELVGKMKDGTALEIISVDGEWIKMSSGDVNGYVKSEYVLTGDEAYEAAAGEVTTIATVNTTTLYARQEPSTDSKIFYLLSNGEKFEVTNDLDEWKEIKVDEDTVYVSSEFVDTKQELPTALTMTEVKYGEGVSDVRVDLVNYATQFVGNPYVWGGVSLTNGCDCSGFVLSVYSHYGIGLPHSSRSQSGYGKSISASEAKPGDLFFYGSGSISHVAIYIGNGRIVHASNHRDGIKISSAFYRTPICVRSLL